MATSVLCQLVFVFILTVRNFRTAPTDSVSLSSVHSRPEGRYDAAFTDGYFCYPDKCWCTSHVANCSRNYGNLTFIPHLPQTIRILDFSFNNLTEIPDSSFFENATGITDLDLTGNNITFIGEDAFSLLTKLTVLYLMDNEKLNNSCLPPVFSVTTLKRVSFRYDDLGPLADDIFYTHPMKHLEVLYLHHNFIARVNFSALAPLVRLTNLGLSSNYIQEIVPSRTPLAHLDTLTLWSNNIISFPVTCGSNGNSLFPRLKRLFLDNNQIKRVPDDVCLPRLLHLDLSRNHFVAFEPVKLNLHRMPQLQEVFLEQMHTRVVSVSKNAFQSASLERLSLMFNDLNFAADFVDRGMFGGCPRLNDLQLSHNFFDKMTEENWNNLFGSLTGMMYLYLDYTAITRIPQVLGTLDSLRKLVLSQNRISHVPDGIVDGLSRLTWFQLDNNQISVVQDSAFSGETLHRLSHLDLSGNPFTCSCDVIWFRQQLLYHGKLFKHSVSTYHCANIPNTTVVLFYKPDQACLMSRDASTFLAVTLALLISTLTLVSLLVRYRWQLRLLLYEAFRGRAEARRRRLEQQHFDYDVFVSYAAEDLHWVFHHLMPELEQRLGLRLCVHERDFIPGKPIVDNIEESVQSSKKILMVFSTHFAHSQWCQFELQLCLSYVMEQDDALLVVLLQDVPAHDMTSAMMAVLNTTSYVQWDEDPDAIASFWGRIHIALNEILP